MTGRATPYRVQIDPRAQRYYDRMTTEAAIQAARERIEEWDYDSDPHGYCHERPMLVRLVQEITRGR
jgi:hypothetical protein